MIGHSLGAAAVGAWLNETQRDLRAVLVAPPTSVERYSGYFARSMGIAEPVRRAMQERFERSLGKRWSEFELPGSVANVRASMLVVHDEDDRDVPLKSGLALARAWKDARLCVTRGLGHRRILRASEVVRDAVDFIANRVVFAPPPARGETLPYGARRPSSDLANDRKQETAMKRNRPFENTPRVLAVAVAFFGGLGALGYA
jgi:hypothetical protein